MSPHLPSESILRAMWLSRFFERLPLYTNDNTPVAVLEGGRLNHDGGPDVLDARVRIGPTVFRGDVEFHSEASSWYAHGHHLDEHYNRTILHLVFSIRPSDLPTTTLSGRVVPLVLTSPSSDFLMPDADYDTHLPCYDFNRSVTSEIVTAWLAQLARIRMERRVLQLGERLRQLMIEEQPMVHELGERYPGELGKIQPALESDFSEGLRDEAIWEQLLYEGLMEASGYEKNRKPFLALARAVRLTMLRRIGLDDTQAIMALLFGAAGLFPSSRAVTDPESRAYLHRLLRRWKELRQSYHGPLLHAGDWMFFRLRPANFPSTRLAAICFLLPRLFRNRTFHDIVLLLNRAKHPPRQTLRMLDHLLSARPDAYWRTHFRFGPRTTGPAVLPGHARRQDMIANHLLPMMILYGRTFALSRMDERAYDLYFLMPSLQHNRITRLMAAELPGVVQLRSAVLQQGAMQLLHEYCTRGRCGQCAIGRSVGLWGLSPDQISPEIC